MTKSSIALRLVAGALCALASTGAALAADIPVKAPLLSATTYNWTGIYVGAHVGYGGGMEDWFSSPFDYVMKGPLAGGQIGVNQQIGNWVIGVEVDASWADIKGRQDVVSGGVFNGLIQTRSSSSAIDRLVTMAGRVGLAQDRWLVYAKLGAVWVHEAHPFNASNTLFLLVGPPLFASAVATGGETRFAPMLGFGAEYAFLGNWSAKLEYNYLPLSNKGVQLVGTQTIIGVTSAFNPVVDIYQTIHLVKLGVNYRFGPDGAPPIMAARPAPGVDWTGVYAGVQAGYGFGRTQWPDFVLAREFNVKGWHAGGTLGANAQAGVFVLGVETEWMWANIKGNTTFAAPFLGIGTQTTMLSTSIDWLATASLRAGFVAADRWMIYGKAGIVVANEKHTLGAIQALPPPFVDITTFDLSGNALHTGYLVGAGLEYALENHWSLKFEYDYVALRRQGVVVSGTETVNFFGLVGTNASIQTTGIRQDLHLVKLGLNYHFNPLDVVTARY